MELFLIVAIIFALLVASLVALLAVYILLRSYRTKLYAEKELNEELSIRLSQDRHEIVKLKTTMAKLGRVVKVEQPLPKGKKKRDMWLAFQDSEAVKYISVDHSKETMTLFVVTPPTKEEKKEFKKSIEQ